MVTFADNWKTKTERFRDFLYIFHLYVKCFTISGVSIFGKWLDFFS